MDESRTRSFATDSTEVIGLLDAVTWLAFYNTTKTTFNGFQTIDSVTAAMIYGKDGVPVDTLFKSKPEEYLIPRLQNIVGVTAAQYISYFYRTTNSTLPLINSTIPATLQMGPGYRLKQNATSTRILDALLVACTLFAAITMFSFRCHDVAKAKLGSVAATLALVADSEFVQDLTSSVRDTVDGESEEAWSAQRSAAMRMEQKLSSQGYQFSLGWWSDSRAPPLTAAENAVLRTRRRWENDVGKAE